MFGKADEKLRKENAGLVFANEKLARDIDKIKKELSKEKVSLTDTIDSLSNDKRRLKEEVADLELKKKIENEDLKHMIKIKEEKAEIVMEKKQLEMQRESDKAIQKIRDEYQKKTEDSLEEQIKKMGETTDKIMSLVPNIGVKLNGNITK